MNSMAMLVTRGCSEMRKLAIAMGSRAETLAGLSGIGDLMLTCYGSLSRNRTVGKRLGEGEKLEDVRVCIPAPLFECSVLTRRCDAWQILASMTEVAEGVATSQAAAKLAQQYHLDLPIVMTGTFAHAREIRTLCNERHRECELTALSRSLALYRSSFCHVITCSGHRDQRRALSQGGSDALDDDTDGSRGLIDSRGGRR